MESLLGRRQIFCYRYLGNSEFKVPILELSFMIGSKGYNGKVYFFFFIIFYILFLAALGLAAAGATLWLLCTGFSLEWLLVGEQGL